MGAVNTRPIYETLFTRSFSYTLFNLGFGALFQLLAPLLEVYRWRISFDVPDR